MDRIIQNYCTLLPFSGIGYGVMLNACKKGHLGMVKRFFALGKLNQASTNHAAANGHLSVVQYLYQQGIHGTRWAMDWAICYGHLPVVKYLYSQGQRCTRVGVATILAKKGNLEMMKYLDSIHYPFTSFAMDAAAEEGNLEMVQFLGSIHTIVSTETVDLAIKKDYLDIVKYLHSIGGECYWGMGYAINNGSLKMVKFLHQIGESCGKDQLKQAKRRGHDRVVRYIQKAIREEEKQSCGEDLPCK